MGEASTPAHSSPRHTTPSPPSPPHRLHPGHRRPAIRINRLPSPYVRRAARLPHHLRHPHPLRPRQLPPALPPVRVRSPTPPLHPRPLAPGPVPLLLHAVLRRDRRAAAILGDATPRCGFWGREGAESGAESVAEVDGHADGGRCRGGPGCRGVGRGEGAHVPDDAQRRAPRLPRAGGGVCASAYARARARAGRAKWKGGCVGAWRGGSGVLCRKSEQVMCAPSSDMYLRLHLKSDTGWHVSKQKRPPRWWGGGQSAACPGTWPSAMPRSTSNYAQATVPRSANASHATVSLPPPQITAVMDTALSSPVVPRFLAACPW
jgi:hypothetical protein